MGKRIPKLNPDDVRKDTCKIAIAKSDYGKQKKFGWEIDHIKPVAKGN